MSNTSHQKSQIELASSTDNHSTEMNSETSARETSDDLSALANQLQNLSLGPRMPPQSITPNALSLGQVPSSSPSCEFALSGFQSTRAFEDDQVESASSPTLFTTAPQTPVATSPVHWPSTSLQYHGVPVNLLSLPSEVRVMIAGFLFERGGHIGVSQYQLESLDPEHITRLDLLGIGSQTFQLPGGPIPGAGLLGASKSLRADAEEVLKSFTLDIHLFIHPFRLVCVVVGNKVCFRTGKNSADWAARFLQECDGMMLRCSHALQITVHIEDRWEGRKYERGLGLVLSNFLRILALHTSGKSIAINFQVSRPQDFHNSFKDFDSLSRPFQLLRCRHAALNVNFTQPDVSPVLLRLKHITESSASVQDCMAVFLGTRASLWTLFVDTGFLPPAGHYGLNGALKSWDYGTLSEFWDRTQKFITDPDFITFKEVIAQGNFHGKQARRLKTVLMTRHRILLFPEEYEFDGRRREILEGKTVEDRCKEWIIVSDPATWLF